MQSSSHVCILSRLLAVFFVSFAYFGLSLASADPINIPKIDADIQRMMDGPDMVGLAVAIVENGELVHVKGYGETLAGSGDKVTVETLFRWASLSKGVAGAVSAQLENMGYMSLTDPAAKYSKSLKLPQGGERHATVEHVLSHQLGIVRNAYDNRLELGVSPEQIRSELSALKYECEIGTCHTYQNVAFDSVSEMVSSVTHDSYENAVRELLFRPIGMASANMSLKGLLHADRFARPHNARGYNVYRKQRGYYYRVPAAGGVNSNILDLGLWMQAQMGLFPSVLDQETLEVVQTPKVVTLREQRRSRRLYPRISSAEYGLGWRIYNYAGRRVIGHRGAVNGYRALILFDDDMDTGIAMLWNSGSRRPVGLQMLVMDMAYGLQPQDWLYFNKGPDMRRLRRELGAAPEPERPPMPKLSPYRQPDYYPELHGNPFYTVAGCYGFTAY